MPSIVSSYEYDIFISYRQKDNRSDQWVTNFVQALREELDATFKEEVSIYFDSNPHDGLLETHDVDGSLKGKIKCLVFIPIVSQTYCDPKSFAWQKEFFAFLDFAKADEFGLDIKLSNGNVAKRVLPVRIHEIDKADKKLFEDAVGGVMRCVDFIYQEPGVNRPLQSNEESPSRNLNQTFYRNQVNKVANAVKELIASIKPSEKTLKSRLEEKIANPTKQTHKVGGVIAAIVLVLALVGYFLYPKLIQISKPEEIEKSIVVLPFTNMSGDPEQEYFSDGITEEIISNLVQIKELKVIGRTSSFQFKGKNIDLREIGSQLGVAYILEGSIRKSGNQLRITAQMINVTDGSQLWSKTFNKELKDVFEIQDELSLAIADQLKISFGLTKKNQANLELYDLYLKAKTLFLERGVGVQLSIKIFEQIIEKDSTYQPAWTGLAQAWLVIPLYSFGDTLLQRVYTWPKVMRTVERALLLNPNDAEALAAKATLFREQRDFVKALEYYEKAMAFNDQLPIILEDYCQFLTQVGYVQKSLFHAKRMIALDPLSWLYQLAYGDALLQNGMMSESAHAFKIAIKLNPVHNAPRQGLSSAYLNMNRIDSAISVLEGSNIRQKVEWINQLMAVKKEDFQFDFRKISNKNSVDNLSGSTKLYFAMNELNQLDSFFDELMMVSRDRFKAMNLFSIFTPQGLTKHSERFLSDPRMKEVLKNYGLVKFWEINGWPDRCRPIGNGDFICK